MPVYNGEPFLERSIGSVLSQSFQDFELVICNDRSTDHSLNIIQKFAKQDPRIRVIQNEQNLGMIRNWQTALSAGKGQNLALLMQDDFYGPQFLATSAAFMDKYKLQVFSSWGNLCDEHGALVEIHTLSHFTRHLESFRTQENCLIFKGSEFLKAFIADFKMGYLKFALSFSAFERKLFEQVGGVDLSLKYCAETEMFLRFASQGARFGYLQETCLATIMGSGPTRQSTQAPFTRKWEDFYRIPALMLENRQIDQLTYRQFVSHLNQDLIRNSGIMGPGGVLDILHLLVKHNGIQKVPAKIPALLVSALDQRLSRLKEKLLRKV